jgi:hypothetical protein
LNLSGISRHIVASTSTHFHFHDLAPLSKSLTLALPLPRTPTNNYHTNTTIAALLHMALFQKNRER